MIVVTGGAGFVGSNIVHRLNAEGRSDILVVDDLTDTRKLANISGAGIADFVAIDRFRDLIATGHERLADVSLVLHQGASSSTTEPDSRYVLDNNYEYSRELIGFCADRSIPVIYASSAAAYGAATDFVEHPANETPLNVYGWSKLLVDNYVRRRLHSIASQVVGLRYFNVYGPREAHKDEMASIVTQLDAELRSSGTATIFGASHGVGPGEQRRDFVAVDDVVDVILWFAAHPDRSGIFNCGTGASTTFGDVAAAVVAAHGTGEVRFTEFPEALVDRYQVSTAADLTALRAAGYGGSFAPPAVGIARYLAASDG